MGKCEVTTLGVSSTEGKGGTAMITSASDRATNLSEASLGQDKGNKHFSEDYSVWKTQRVSSNFFIFRLVIAICQSISPESQEMPFIAVVTPV